MKSEKAGSKPLSAWHTTFSYSVPFFLWSFFSIPKRVAVFNLPLTTWKFDNKSRKKRGLVWWIVNIKWSVCTTLCLTCNETYIIKSMENVHAGIHHFGSYKNVHASISFTFSKDLAVHRVIMCPDLNKSIFFHPDIHKKWWNDVLSDKKWWMLGLCRL